MSDSSASEKTECNALIGAIESWVIGKSVELLVFAKQSMEPKKEVGVVWIGFKSMEEAQTKRDGFSMSYIPLNPENQQAFYFMKNPRLSKALSKYDPNIHFILVVSIDGSSSGKKTDGKCNWRWNVIHGDACNRVNKDDLMYAPLLPDVEMDHKEQINILGGIASCANPDCKKQDISLQRCARCKGLYYCSTACQKIHWPHHKEMCTAMLQLRNAFVSTTTDLKN